MPYYFEENFKEFCQRMNCDRIEHNRDQRHWVFANGGRSNFENQHIDPPTDEWELLKCQRLFWQTKLDRATKTFNEAHSDISDQVKWHTRSPSSCMQPNPLGPQILRTMKMEVVKARIKLNAINTRLENSPEALRKREERAEEDTRLQRLAELTRQLDSIRID